MSDATKPPTTEPNEVLYPCFDAMVAWARADRVADDMTASLHAIERRIKASPIPVPTELITEHREMMAAFTVICRAENDALEKIQEIARALIDLEMPAPGVARELKPEVVCTTCNDTHRMHLANLERDVPCTQCPAPCTKCATDRGHGPYCATTPCDCRCHLLRERRSRDARAPRKVQR